MEAKTCVKCGGALEAGFTTASGLIGGDGTESREPKLVFVVPGTNTSANPLRAFNQGLADEKANRAFGIQGFRCSRCGRLELYADGSLGSGARA
jgi:hypothetical protein